jgi:hypothetical protein
LIDDFQHLSHSFTAIALDAIAIELKVSLKTPVEFSMWNKLCLEPKNALMNVPFGSETAIERKTALSVRNFDIHGSAHPGDVSLMQSEAHYTCFVVFVLIGPFQKHVAFNRPELPTFAAYQYPRLCRKTVGY